MSPDHETGAERLQETLARFARTIVHDYSVEDALQEVAEATVELLPVTGATLSVADDEGRLAFVGVAGDVLAHVEALESVSVASPVGHAYRTGEVVAVTDLHDAEGWGAFAQIALDVGIRGVAGFPMPLDDDRIGALGVYRDRPLERPDDWQDTGQLLADLATTYAVASRRQRASDELTGQLRHALTHRVVVEQAKGVLAGRHGTSLDIGLDALRTYARDRNLRLQEVARAVVRGEIDPLA